MPSLSEVTDHMLLRNGLVSVREIERNGQVMKKMTCFSLSDDRHVWGQAQASIEGEPGFHVCANCGTIKRATPAALMMALLDQHPVWEPV